MVFVIECYRFYTNLYCVKLALRFFTVARFSCWYFGADRCGFERVGYSDVCRAVEAVRDVYGEVFGCFDVSSRRFGPDSVFGGENSYGNRYDYEIRKSFDCRKGWIIYIYFFKGEDAEKELKKLSFNLKIIVKLCDIYSENLGNSYEKLLELLLVLNKCSAPVLKSYCRNTKLIESVQINLFAGTAPLVKNLISDRQFVHVTASNCTIIFDNT